MVETALKRKWRVRADGWIDGRRARAGAIVEMTDAQARYEPVEPVAVDPPRPAQKRRPEEDPA